MLFARGTLSEEEDKVDDDEGDGKGMSADSPCS